VSRASKRNLGVVAVLALAAAFLASAVSAQAGLNPVVVNSVGDKNDSQVGDGICDTEQTNSQGDPECTLRAAIEEANASSVNAIHFDLPTSEPGYDAGSNTWIISPTNEMEELTSPATIIDGTTQPGFAGKPIITYDGSNTGSTRAGLELDTDDSGIFGLAIVSWEGPGIYINGDRNVVRAVRVGADALNNSAPNQGYGIEVRNSTDTQIGGPSAADTVVIANSDQDGIYLDGAQDTIIQNALVGVHDDPASTPAGNADHGIRITGGSQGTQIGGSAATGNTIAHNGGAGIEISDNGSTGNTISGNSMYGNGQPGIDLGGDGPTANDPGDTDSGPNDLLNTPELVSAVSSGASTTVSFNLDLQAGPHIVEIFVSPAGAGAGEGHNPIQTFSFGSTNSATLYTQVITASAGDVITATTTQGTAGAPGATSEVSAPITVASSQPVVVNSTGTAADLVAGDGLCDTGALNSAGDTECTLAAAIQEANAGPASLIEFDMPTTEPGHNGGVWAIAPTGGLDQVTSTATIDGRTQPGWTSSPIIEIDGTGNPYGLSLAASAPNSEIFGLSVINSSGPGIEIRASNSIAAFNYVGTDSGGQTARPNIDGIRITDATNVVIEDNLLSGNSTSGVVVSGTGGLHVIEGNLIGIEALQRWPLANGVSGVLVEGGTDTAIVDNIIGGNTGSGIYLQSAQRTQVEGNLIGLGTAGTQGLANRASGITVAFGASDTIIGTAANPNTISENLNDGIFIDNSGPVRIEHNFIGTTSSGASNVGNSFDGVFVTNQTDTVRIANNTISHNGEDGIAVTSTTTGTVAMIANLFTGNGEEAIDLAKDGGAMNDPGDADSGPNDLLNYPTILSTTALGAGFLTTYELDAPAGQYTIYTYSNPSGPDPSGFGEGEVLEQLEIVSHAGGIQQHTSTSALNVAIGESLSAYMALNGDGIASEFGPNFVVTPAPPPASPTTVVNSTEDVGDANPGDGVCHTGAVNTAGAPECTLRAAIEESNASGNVTRIEFAIPTTEAGYSSAWILTPTTSYPTITSPVEIDARTQPSYTSFPRISIDGSLLGSTSALDADAQLAIRALSFHDFNGDVVVLRGNDSAVTESRFGVNPAGGVSSTVGTAITASGLSGLTIDRNSIFNARTNGILLDNVDDVSITSNQMFSNITSIRTRGTVTNTTVGGDTLSSNTIFYGTHGVVVEDSPTPSEVQILSNSIARQSVIGIDLGDDGQDLNDAGDVDSGPNDRLNKPEIIQAVDDGTNTQLDITLTPETAGTYSVEVFRSTNTTGTQDHAEALVYRATQNLATPQTITATFASAPGRYTATLTRVETGLPFITSEISESVTPPPPNQVQAIPDQTNDEGDLVLSLQVVGTPGGTAPLAYSQSGLPPGLAINPTTGEITGNLTYSSSGVWPVTITATSADAAPGTVTFLWTVAEVNLPPSLTVTSPLNAIEGSSTSFPVTSADPDGDTLSFSATGLPPNLTINPTTGTISGTPTFASAGSYPAQITVSDGVLSTTRSTVIIVSDTNRPPVVNTLADQNTSSGQQLSLQMTGNDPDGDSLLWSAVGLPAGVTINPGTGLISGTASGPQTLTITVMVSDGRGGVDQETFIWTIAAPPTTTTTTTTTSTTTTTTLPPTTTAAPTTTTTAAPTTTTNAPPTTTTTTLPPTTTTAAPTTTNAPTTTATPSTTSTTSTTTVPPTLPFTNLIASDDTFAVSQDTTIVDVLANDTFGQDPRIVSTTQPAIGSVTITDEGQLAVTVPPSFGGEIAFSYTLTDESGIESTADVLIRSVNVLAPATGAGAEPSELLSVRDVLSRVTTLFTGLVRIRLSTIQVTTLAFAPLLFGLLRLFFVRREDLVSVTNAPRRRSVDVNTSSGLFKVRHNALVWTARKTRRESTGVEQTQIELPNGDTAWIDSNLIVDTGY